jgi:hypothetical protein
MNKHTLYMSLAFVALTATTSFSQGLPVNLYLAQDRSLNETDAKVYQATSGIYFQTGFSAKVGCSLFASVVTAEERSTPTAPSADNVLSVYPNPTTGAVTVNGIYLRERLTIYDDLGSPVQTLTLDGENPTVTPALRPGQYVFQAAGRSIRVEKK